VIPVNRIDALIAQADVLANQVRSARAEAIRVGSDPLASGAAVRAASRRLAFATGKANGFAALVALALPKRPGSN
jgi:hypothetical protein